MKKFPLMRRRSVTQKDLENLAALQTMSGGSPGAQRSRPAHKEEDPPEHRSKDSGSTPDLLRSSQDLTPEERKKILNDRDREARLQQLQDRLEIQNELKESGYLIHRINR